MPASGVVFYSEKKQRHIYIGFFLSPQTRADIKPRGGVEDSLERYFSNKIDHQNFTVSLFESVVRHT